MRILKALALFAAQVYAELFETPGVETLTSENWKEQVEDDADNAWVVTFYADWCPYCKTFSEEFGAASIDPALDGKKVKFGAVDVMENRDLTKKFGIKRSPTVKIFGKDRDEPEDYTGQRKQADLVEKCTEFCDKNEFVESEPEQLKETEFDYNIDSIVKIISDAHATRVLDSTNSLNQGLKSFETELAESLKKVKTEYQERLDALSKERKEALQAAFDAVQEKITDAKAEQALSIANMDDEAITVIESIIAKHKAKAELSDYITALDKNWFTIAWDHTMRRKKGESVNIPVQAGYGYGANAAGLYGVAGGAIAAGTGAVPQLANQAYQTSQQNAAYGAATGAAQASYGGASYGQQAGYKQASGAGYQQPIVVAQHPQKGYQGLQKQLVKQRGYGVAQHSYGGAQQGYGGVQQGYGGVQQSYGGAQAQSGYGATAGGYGGAQSAYGNQLGSGYQQRGYQGGYQGGYY